MDNATIVLEVLKLIEALPTLRFALLYMLLLAVAVGYLLGNIPWDKIL